MADTPHVFICPECDSELEFDAGVPLAGDIIECDCGTSLLVEDDLSLTPGEVGDDGEFEADDECEDEVEGFEEEEDEEDGD